MFALALLAGVCFVALVAFRVRKNPTTASSVFVRLFGRISPKLGHAVGKRVLAFGEGLNTVKDMKSFFQLSALSIVIWLFIGIAYLAVTHAYSIHRLSQMTLSSVFLLDGGERRGGRVTASGRGRRFTARNHRHARGVFSLSPELATSCESCSGW